MSEIITTSISSRKVLEGYGMTCIVRCRDCKKHTRDSLGLFCDELYDDEGQGPRPVNPDDYCSWGVA